MIFAKKTQIKKDIFFLRLIFHVITTPQTLKGSWNIQGLTLIQAVLSCFPSLVYHVSQKNLQFEDFLLDQPNLVLNCSAPKKWQKL